MKKLLFWSIALITIIGISFGIAHSDELRGVTLQGVGSATAMPAYFWPLETNLIPTMGSDTYIGIETHAGTNRTRVNPGTGLVEAVGANVARFEEVGGYRALLIEPEATNLVTYSEQFDDASWAKIRSSITVNAVVGPDGTLTADKLVEDGTASNSHLAIVSIAKESFTDDSSVTFSVYAKSDERTWICLQIGNKTPSYLYAYFNLATGAVGTETVDSYGSEPAANGFTRYWVTNTIGSGSSDCVFYILLASGDNTRNYSGDGSSGIYIDKTQIEESPVPTSYIPTSGATVTRATESGSPSFAEPPVFNASGTLIAWVRPAFAYGDVSAGDYGIVACDDAAKSLLYFDENGMICSYDGTTEATSGAINWSASTWIKVVVKWGNGSFRVGYDNGSGLTWGTAQSFDGSFDVTGDKLRIGYGLFNRQHVRNISIFDTILTDSKIEEWS